MKILLLRGTGEVWVQGDDGQVVELYPLTKFETIYATGLAMGTVSAHMEFGDVEFDYVNSIPRKDKSTTNIRKRKMR